MISWVGAGAMGQRGGRGHGLWGTPVGICMGDHAYFHADRVAMITGIWGIGVVGLIGQVCNECFMVFCDLPAMCMHARVLGRAFAMGLVLVICLLCMCMHAHGHAFMVGRVLVICLLCACMHMAMPSQWGRYIY